MEVDRLQVLREDRRLLVHLASDDAVGVHDLSIPDDAHLEFRHVHPDVRFAEILRHPAPLFHVGEDTSSERLRLTQGGLTVVRSNSVLLSAGAIDPSSATRFPSNRASRHAGRDRRRKQATRYPPFESKIEGRYDEEREQGCRDETPGDHRR